MMSFKDLLIKSTRSQRDFVKVFDWEKAAKFIKEKAPKEVYIGLEEDLEWTSGCIFKEGTAIKNSWCYLKSHWATPVLMLDNETSIECYIPKIEADLKGWDEKTMWPQEALDILGIEKKDLKEDNEDE